MLQAAWLIFPENVDDVHSICEHVAHDIRNQYILAYYPSKHPPRRHLPRHSGGSDSPARPRQALARTRNGYYAPTEKAFRRRQLTIRRG